MKRCTKCGSDDIAACERDDSAELEYICNVCDTILEECPFCGGDTVERVIETFRSGLIEVQGVGFFKCIHCQHSWLPAEEEMKIDCALKGAS